MTHAGWTSAATWPASRCGAWCASDWARKRESGRCWLLRRAARSSGGLRWTSVDEVLAEQVGFEPTVRHNRTPDFESGAFDHSATAPDFDRCGAKPEILTDQGRMDSTPPM